MHRFALSRSSAGTIKSSASSHTILSPCVASACRSWHSISYPVSDLGWHWPSIPDSIPSFRTIAHLTHTVWRSFLMQRCILFGSTPARLPYQPRVTFCHLRSCLPMHPHHFQHRRKQNLYFRQSRRALHQLKWLQPLLHKSLSANSPRRSVQLRATFSCHSHQF